MNSERKDPYKKMVQETLESFDGIKRAALKEDRISKIVSAALTAKGKIAVMNPAAKWAIAASIAVLYGINILSAVKYSSENITNENPVYQEYFSGFPNY
jgi:hypothetical protein